MTASLTMEDLEGVRTSGAYPGAIAMAFFSMVVLILITPAWFQHYQNRNVGATVLVSAVILSNLINFTNAIIWSNDDIPHWFNGVGLCDIQIKLMIGLSTMLPAAMSCILRTLANVMDTDNATWAQTSAQKRRGYIIDLALSVGVPLIQMPLHYVVQGARIVVQGIAGCTPQIDDSWPSLVLVLLPPVLFEVVNIYYSALILIRLIRYRRTFNSILANSNTTKSRFIRLYGVCCLTIVCMAPIYVFIFFSQSGFGISNLQAYSWDRIHNNPDVPWNVSIMIPSRGQIYSDRYIWLIGGYVAFLFFGFGRDAVKTYKSGLLLIGLGRFFPMLRPDYQHRGSISTTISTIGSKAKLFFNKRRDSNATWANSTTSTLTSDTTSSSPKKMTFLESMREEKEHRQSRQPGSPVRQSSNPLTRLTSIFKKKPHQPLINGDPFLL